MVERGNCGIHGEFDSPAGCPLCQSAAEFHQAGTSVESVCWRHGRYDGVGDCPKCSQRTVSRIVPPPAGCICPPTSEQTCQNPTCPRRDPMGGERRSGLGGIGV